jgi:hypothetical protein
MVDPLVVAIKGNIIMADPRFLAYFRGASGNNPNRESVALIIDAGYNRIRGNNI